MSEERRRDQTGTAGLRGNERAISANRMGLELVSLLEKPECSLSNPWNSVPARHSFARSPTRGEYLPNRYPSDAPQAVTQMPAPVFDAACRSAYTFIGPPDDSRLEEVWVLGNRLMEAAAKTAARFGAIRQ